MCGVHGNSPAPPVRNVWCPWQLSCAARQNLLRADFEPILKTRPRSCTPHQGQCRQLTWWTSTARRRRFVDDVLKLTDRCSSGWSTR
ncbi:hypothetical protein EVAR_88030_1 [Eumeta japonica]|uniref:Uncharacterized protein n=1 Tax=Eumeta variegata TaxID=151549 RepID=A0A4C1VD37_EUMVA|nr:hypothetical protein EVAR_88030_1 [Eumeta japonica]